MGNQTVGNDRKYGEGRVYRKGELARARLVEAAVGLFAERGYHGCSINDMVSASGLTRNQLFHHFGSKENLAVAAVLRAKAAWRESVFAPTAAFMDPGSRFMNLLAAHRSLSLAGWAPGMLFASLAASRSVLPGALQAEVDASIRDIREFLRSLIKDLKQAGSLNCPGKARDLAALVTQVLLGSQLLWAAADGKDADAVYELITAIVLR